MGLYFTGKGDAGESSVGPNKIDKSSQEIETVGELDEINSLLGIIKAENIGNEFKKIIDDIQQNLFIVQANTAEFMFQDETGKPKYPAPAFSEDKVKKIEEVINNYEKEVDPKRGFVIAGSDKVSAFLDYARAVSRRAERAVVRFNKIHPLDKSIMAYMNRLSSLLFAMARVNSKRGNKPESNPSYK